MGYQSLIAELATSLDQRVLWAREYDPTSSYWQWGGKVPCALCGKSLGNPRDALGVGVIRPDGQHLTRYVCADREQCGKIGASDTVIHEPDKEKEVLARDESGFAKDRKRSKGGFTK